MIERSASRPTFFMSSPWPAMPTTSVPNNSGTIMDLIIRRNTFDNSWRSAADQPPWIARSDVGNSTPRATPTTIETTIHWDNESRRSIPRRGSMGVMAGGCVIYRLASALDRRRRRDRYGWSAAPEGGVLEPIREIQQQSHRHPDPEPLPRAHGKTDHRVDARERSRDAHEPDEWHLERTRPIGLLVAQHQHADAHDRERRERSDVRQVVDLVLVEHQAAEGHDQAGHDRRDVRRPVLGVDLGGPLREQAVARHGEEDARLAVLKDEQHRGQRDDGACRDDPARRRQPGDLERLRERIRCFELLIRHDAGRDDADNDIDDRADGEADENASRHVPLRILRLLRGGTDRVETDVGKEHDRGTLVNATP